MTINLDNFVKAIQEAILGAKRVTYGPQHRTA